MSRPIRLKLSRKKGFNLQAWSNDINGRPAVNVARPSKWGNRYRIAAAYRDEYCSIPAIDPDAAVKLYREHLEGLLRIHQARGSDLLAPLRGRNLACWCGLDAPCHANVLLELAEQG